MPTVFLHVGTAKSGTTYLQRALAANRGPLRAHGVAYPGRQPSHFLAATDLRGVGFHGDPVPGADGAWAALVDEVRTFPGNAVVSHESLAKAPAAAIAKAVSSFPDHDVRVLITCRDLGRLLPAMWQEKVRNGNTVEYDAYVDRVFDAWDGTRLARDGVFWWPQHVAALAERWADVVGTDQVSLVTVPPPGSDRELLWRRFAAAAELPDLGYRADDAKANSSLGAAEAELLRRVNRLLPDSLPWPKYQRLVKNGLVPRLLAPHRVAGPIAVPERHQATACAIGEHLIGELRERGYVVHGDLEDLRPTFEPGRSPRCVDDAQLLDLALRVLAAAAIAPARPPSPPRSAAATGPAGSRTAARVRGRLARWGRRRSEG